MTYNTEKPVYLQILDYICNQIVLNNWKTDEKIPSVRELSVTISVNPNTTFRAIERAESIGIIYIKRGLGYFVSADAKQKIEDIFKVEFFEEMLPVVFNKMLLYDISIENIEQKFIDFKSKNKKN